MSMTTSIEFPPSGRRALHRIFGSGSANEASLGLPQRPSWTASESFTGLGLNEYAELHRQGAKSAARGDSRAENPMLRMVNRSETTGEARKIWLQRSMAWRAGFTAQSKASRSSRP